MNEEFMSLLRGSRCGKKNEPLPSPILRRGHFYLSSHGMDVFLLFFVAFAIFIWMNECFHWRVVRVVVNEGG